jgi:hypothetical protein
MRTPLTWNYFTRSTPIKISVYVKETAQSLKSLSAARVMSFEILFVQCAWLKITHRPGTNCARYGITYYGWLFLLPRARAHMPITATQQVTNYILILMRCCREDVKYDCASRELLYTMGLLCVSACFSSAHFSLFVRCAPCSRDPRRLVVCFDTLLLGTPSVHWERHLVVSLLATTAMQLHHFQVDTMCWNTACEINLMFILRLIACSATWLHWQAWCNLAHLVLVMIALIISANLSSFIIFIWFH